jgi:hypothetical protein
MLSYWLGATFYSHEERWIFIRGTSTIEERDSGVSIGKEIQIFFENKACVPNLYMVYSKSGQENTRNTVRQAKQISFERNLKKELAKLVRM